MKTEHPQADGTVRGTKGIVCQSIHFVPPGPPMPPNVETGEDPNEEARFFSREQLFGSLGFQIEIDHAQHLVWIASRKETRLDDGKVHAKIGPWNVAALSNMTGATPLRGELPKINEWLPARPDVPAFPDLVPDPDPIVPDDHHQTETVGKPSVTEMISKAVGKGETKTART